MWYNTFWGNQMIRNFNFLLCILLFYCTNYLAGHYFCIFILLPSSSAFVMCFKKVEHSWDVIQHFLHLRIMLEVERYFVFDALRLGEFWVCLITTLIPFSILFLYFPYLCNSILFKKNVGTGLYVITMLSICALMHVRMYEGLFILLSICHMKFFI